jgi:hypothetical protein
MVLPLLGTLLIAAIAVVSLLLFSDRFERPVDGDEPGGELPLP